MKVVQVNDERLRLYVEAMVREEFTDKHWKYTAYREPVMFAALDDGMVLGVLCARPYQCHLSDGFRKYFPALDCPSVCETGKIVVRQSARHGARVLKSLMYEMHKWLTAAGFWSFYFETHPDLAEKYIHAFGFARIGDVIEAETVGAPSALLFSTLNNPRLCRFLFGR